MVKNQQLAQKLLEIIETLSQATSQLYCKIMDSVDCNEFIQLMLTLLSKAENPLLELSKEETALMSYSMCKNVKYSFMNIIKLKETDAEKACKKIKFELLPLIKELYVDLYFWGLCYPDQKKIWEYYENEMPQLCPLPIPKNGKYLYEISVVVVAYNKLDYTKLCLEYLKKYFPKDISHELILVNNGSSDGTKEFFESLNPDKQIDILCNTKSFSFISRIIEGKYILFISNDILITPHAVENMLTCIKSDEKIGCVVPTCPNISNLQTIPGRYSTGQELITFTEQNNRSDPFRWEQRCRLVPPIILARSDTEGIYAFFVYLYPNSPDRFLAFVDDLMCLLYRRQGFKCILAKDAFVHHFGSVTSNEEIKTQCKDEPYNFYAAGRRDFENTFGIDPWSTGFCFDRVLLNALSPENSGPVKILGVNCGFGSNPCKIKDILLEKNKNQQVKVYNITNQAQYFDDLKGISDIFQSFDKWNKIEFIFPHEAFSYIIVEDIDKQNDVFQIIGKLFNRLLPDGVMAIKSKDGYVQNNIKGLFKRYRSVGSWIIISN